MVEVVAVSGSGVEAAREAMAALKSGNNVVMLGSGISLAEEAELKRAAAARRLLLLGPACGTALLDGKGFGIWNSVRKGPIGIIGTFGSGVQQVACLVEKAGISHALDVGPRDISQRVNAMGAISALDFLESDPDTKVIVILSRAPVTSIERRLLDAARRTGKPTIYCFLGGRAHAPRAGLEQASDFEEAALRASALAHGQTARESAPAAKGNGLKKLAQSEQEHFGYGQKYIRGLYSGGALCTEAMTVIRKSLSTVYSNIPLDPRLRIPDPHSSKGHACIDFGADDLSGGQHPAVNLVPRCERMQKEAKGWETALVLFDVLLGTGAHRNPAGELARAVKKAKETTERLGGYLSAVASIIGTSGDPQNLKNQREQLERAGVLVMGSNAQAAEVATNIVTCGKVRK